MGKKKREEITKSGEQKEGHNLLGAPKFEQLENGRFRCVETGHEMPAHARDSYVESKHCRQGLIDFALARKKPPVNMFKQDPASRSKLICKLTGDTINKSEEHIWKHINGKRFLNMLEKKEAEKEIPNGTPEKKDGGKVKKKKKKTKKVEKNIDEIINDVRNPAGKSSESDDEADFWMPPAGERWDNDDGGDRWGSDPESGPENDNDGDKGVEEDKPEDVELSKQTKRMSLAIGPSAFASRKKKKRTDDA